MILFVELLFLSFSFNFCDPTKRIRIGLTMLERIEL